MDALHERNAVIKLCFDMGVLYRDIIAILAIECGVVISLRQLKRVLKELGLFRRKNYSDVGDVVEFISNQLHGVLFLIKTWTSVFQLLDHLHSL